MSPIGPLARQVYTRAVARSVTDHMSDLQAHLDELDRDTAQALAIACAVTLARLRAASGDAPERPS